MNLQIKSPTTTRPDVFRIGDSMDHDAGDMLAYLQTALTQRRFKPLFQPIVGISGNTRRSYEVLIRMLDKDDNEIRPGAFLPLAVMNGMGEDIDRMVVQMAIEALLASHDAQLLTVNITENTLLSHTFLPWLSEQLTQHRLPAERLGIDISEIALHASPEPALAFCQGLAVLGVPLTISNFGCALEPFALLDQLKPALVTMDETIVRDLIYSSHQKANVQSMVRTLHARGVHVVTPRVEDMAVLPVLWEIGVDYAQGYCLQAPSHEMNYEFVQDEEITLSAPAQ
jgi:EAL domain-containing protein (putative c-di-GMP-specific phosphodiesterase class I)